jgi:hypothetical protein
MGEDHKAVCSAVRAADEAGRRADLPCSSRQLREALINQHSVPRLRRTVMTTEARQNELTPMVQTTTHQPNDFGKRKPQVVREDESADAKGSVAEIFHIAALLLAIAFFAVAIIGCSGA